MVEIIATRSKVQSGEAVLCTKSLECKRAKSRVKGVSIAQVPVKRPQTSFVAVIPELFLASIQLLGRPLQYVDRMCKPLEYVHIPCGAMKTVSQVSRNFFALANGFFVGVASGKFAIDLGTMAHREYAEAKKAYDKGLTKYAAACTVAGIAFTIPTAYTLYHILPEI